MTQLQEACIMRADRCYLAASEHFRRTFKRIPITFSNRMTKSAGNFKWNGFSGSITLSNVLLELNKEAFIADTVGHELAHYFAHIVYGRSVQAHGKEWKSIMKMLGQEPSRCHSMKVIPSTKFIYVVDGEQVNFGKIQHSKLQSGKATYRTKKGKRNILASDWSGV
jgi:SprT protein